MRSRVIGLFGIVGAALLGLVELAGAVDGVIEINQARVDAGNITAGDSAGFPATISKGGSYRLTSDLIPTDNTKDAIVISAPVGQPVTLDLNGFSVRAQYETQNTCSSACPPTCDSHDNLQFGRGIVATTDQGRVAVKNGQVVGMFARGVDLSKSHAHIETVFVENCGGIGVSAGTQSLVVKTVSVSNASSGFDVSAGSQVLDNIARCNKGNGISFGPHGVMIGNSLSQNGGRGFSLGDDVGYLSNVVVFNGIVNQGGNSFSGTNGNIIK